MAVTSISDLRSALDRHNVQVPDDSLPALVNYCGLLWNWNSRLNLTRHTDMDSFVCRDLIDTLRLSQHLPQGIRVLDVGSGGGVPGILLGILRPDLKISLAESVGKKAAALNAIVRKLKLQITVYSDRAENVLKKHRFDVLTVRAVAPLRKLLFWFQLRTGSFQKLLLIKGHRWIDELAKAKEAGLTDRALVEVIDRYPTPGHDNDSVILSVTFSEAPAANA
ncbi:MAG: 16S rRNA (guanine(527)-N(7))-methyltransferase RsmG [Planctomycetaceae bacterium]